MILFPLAAALLFAAFMVTRTFTRRTRIGDFRYEAFTVLLELGLSCIAIGWVAVHEGWLK